MKAPIEKTDAEWKAQLSDVEYEVLRNKGTERAFTGEYYNHFEKGKICLCRLWKRLISFSDEI